MNTLSPRQESILNRVCDTHIATGQPVGSKHITEVYTEVYSRSYSSATVRNEMLALEEKGYLTHPHTSAGRVPTDRGYRHYVDHGLRFEEIPSETFRQASRDLIAYRNRLESFAEQASLLLSQLSGHVSMMIFNESSTEDETKQSLVVRGSSRLLSDQEFKDKSCVERLFEAFEEKAPIIRWLAARPSSSRGASVFIGGENQTDFFQNCSLISVEVICEGNVVGCLALMGARRMRYSKNVPLVAEMGQVLSRVLEQ